ncbi:MAG: double-strand break repair helicase AddA [Hyphomicrobiales bacterium]|nr:double-strand break repair helicase AddA [Hyphomicrobiales bacterium]
MAQTMHATPEQKTASNPEASAWVGANAGSGKTHVLVDRVTRLMLAGVDPMSILCLTFTKAAAKEMANRLHERLGGWVGLSNADLSERLTQMGHDQVDRKTLARARRLFTTALETPGGLKIQTIHAFCERILQLFPVEAGLAPGFAVLESSQSKQLLRQARDHVLRLAQGAEDSVLAKALDIVTRHTHSDSFDGLLERLLSERQSLKDALAEHGSIDGIGEALRRQLGVSPEQSIDTLREQFLMFDRDAIVGMIPLLSAAQATNQKTARNFSALLAETDSAKAEALYRRIYYGVDGEKPKAITSVITEKLMKDNPWIRDWLSEEMRRIQGLIEQIDNLTRIEATSALLTLAAAMIAEFEAAKRFRGAYDFDDLILKTRELLVDKATAQWVLFKLDRGIEHVLVDEAQDTSLSQWQILMALTEEFFSGSGSRAAPDRTLFVVGDRKQSIFSFQGADPDAFEESRAFFEHKITDVGQLFKPVDLTVSYRSTAEVLKSVDVVFAEGTRARVGLDGPHAQTLLHQSNRGNAPGLFELWPLMEADDKAEREPWQAPVDQYPPKSAVRKLAKHLADTIKSWIGKRHIMALNRAVEAGDILILFRTRNSLFDILISELRGAGIPVAGADRLKLSENIAILDMMALVQFVLLPEDDYSLACLLKSPLVPIPLSEDQLFKLAHGRGAASLWARLGASDDPICGMARAVLEQWLQASEGARPFEFLSTVLIRTRKAFLARLGSEAGDALDALLEISLSYEESHSSSLAGFAHWFASEDSEIKRNMDRGRGEVRLMTVHGAKGLESSIVILPDTTSTPRSTATSALMFVEPVPGAPALPFWRLSGLAQSQPIEYWKATDKQTELEEQRRLLYVAMTRARDELYVCGYKVHRDSPENSWYRLVMEALQNQDLRPVELPDGSSCLRLGPDPTVNGMAPVLPRSAPEVPAWLFNSPDIAHHGRAPAPGRRDAGSRVARARGRAIHKILQDLPGMAPDAGLNFARRILARSGLDESLAEKILGLIADPEHRDFFGPDSQAEVSIGSLQPNGQYITERTDRLVIRASDILVLDYKTDWHVPDRLDAGHPHVMQLARYVRTLGQAYDGRPVRAALLWTSLPRLDWIAEDTLREAISSMAAIT